MNEKDKKIDNNEESADNIFPEGVSDEEFEEENPSLLVKKLRERLRLSEAKAREYLDGWQRVRADFVNAKQKEKAIKEEFVRFAEEGLIERILPALQSLDLAISGAEKDQSLPKEWKFGIENVRQQFLGALKEGGLEEIAPKPKEKFDPRLHSAVAVEKTNDQSLEDTVSLLLQRGYSLSGKVLKPAEVIVNSFENN